MKYNVSHKCASHICNLICLVSTLKAAKIKQVELILSTLLNMIYPKYYYLMCNNIKIINEIFYTFILNSQNLVFILLYGTSKFRLITFHMLSNHI